MAAGLRFSSLDHTVEHTWSDPPSGHHLGLGGQGGVGRSVSWAFISGALRTESHDL